VSRNIYDAIFKRQTSVCGVRMSRVEEANGKKKYKIGYSEFVAKQPWFNPYWIGLFGKLLVSIAFVLAIIAFVFSVANKPGPTTLTVFESVQLAVDRFALTITAKDVPGNVALFDLGATIDFRRLMTFLAPPNVLAAGQWGSQLNVFLAEFITNHMTLSNCNITSLVPPLITAQCIGYYTYTYDIGPTLFNLPTVVSSFTAQFIMNPANYKFTSVEALPNATSTFIWYGLSGVESPGPLLVKRSSPSRKRSDDLSTWNLLQNQISALISQGQQQQALTVCNTTQYLALKALFDPMGANTSLPCNGQPQATQLIVPLVCPVGGHGVIDQSCLPPALPLNCSAVESCLTGGDLTLNSLTVTNLVTLNVTQADITHQEIFEVDNLILNGSMTCTTGNTISAGCLPPQFTCSNVSGCLTGTNLTLNNLALNGSLSLAGGLTCATPLVSSCLPNRIATINAISPYTPTLDFTIVGGPGIAVTGGINTLTISSNVNITLVGPVFTIRNVFGVLTITPQNQSAHTFFAGPMSGASTMPSFRFIIPADLPQLNLSSSLNFGGVLPQSLGGTGVSGPYLVAGSGVNVTQQLPGGEMRIDWIGPAVLHVQLAVPTDIFSVTSGPVTVNGTHTFVAVSQSANAVWAGPLAGLPNAPSFRLLQSLDIPQLNVSTHLYGILSVTLGGTGSGTALSGGKIMVSSPSSGSIVEGSLIGVGPGIVVSNPSPLVFSIGTTALLNASLSVPTSVFSLTTPTITGPSSGTLSFDLLAQSANKVWAGPSTGSPAQPTFRLLTNTDLPTTLTPSGLTVSGSTLLGTATSCMAPLLPSCYEISNQTCATGALSANCIPDNLHIANLIVDHLTVLNGTSQATFTNNSFLGDVFVNGTLSCAGSGAISNGCLQLGGYTCPLGMPFADSCIPANLIQLNQTVLNTLTVNNVVCNGPSLPDPCMPIRIKTINGILPTALFDFTIGSSTTGISVTPTANGVTISNTGVTSVGLAAPAAEFAVSGSPVTTTGTLTLTKQTQAARTVWAGPLSGSTVAQPSFRLLQFSDLPDLNLTGTGGVTVINGTIIAGNGATVSSVGLNLPGSVFSVTVSPVTTAGALAASFVTQTQKTFFAGPTTGSPAVPTFRAVQISDLPGLAQGGVYTGTGLGGVVAGTLNGLNGIAVTSDAAGTINITGSGGTITSVDLAVPAAEFVVSGNPLTGTGGTITLTKAAQVKNRVWVGPTSGSNAVPTFRDLVPADLTPFGMTDGQLIIGSSGGAPVLANLVNGSNIVITNTPGGILISSSINASAIGTVYSVALSLPPSIFSVSGSPVTTGGTLTGSFVTQLANLIFAGPATGLASAPTFRSLVLADLPVLTNGRFYIGQDGNGASVSALAAGSGVAITNTGGTTTISTALSVGLSLPASLFSVSGSPVTVSGTLTGTLVTQSANVIFAGPTAGPGSSTPTFRSLVLADLPTLSNGQLYIGNAGVATATSLSAGTGVTITPGPGTLTVSATATVTSVALSLPVSVFSISNSPVTTSGTLTGSFVTQLANLIFAGPSTGAASAPTFRSLVLPDLPALSNGQLYVGNAGVPVATTLTAGTGTSITNGAGSITISNTGVTSVALSLPSIFSVSGSPVTSTGTLTGSLVIQAANTIFAGPSSGSSAAVPTFRAQVLADLPLLTNGQLYVGSTGNAVVATTLSAGSGISIVNAAGSITISSTSSGGSVTSVALALPSIFSVSGSPVTTAGTLTGTLVSQSANTLFIAPDGVSGTPTFRSQVLGDLPRMTNGQMYIGSTGSSVVAATLTGTTNQVNVALGSGSVTLSVPQNIHTAATPTFASMALTAVTNQLTLGATNTATISATASSTSRTYTIADPGANANFVMDSAGALVITNAGTTGQILGKSGAGTAAWQTSGTVGSVGLALPASILTVTGSPVTATGTLTGTLTTQSANTVWAGPTSGGAATPTFRALTSADLPATTSLTQNEVSSTIIVSGFSSSSFTLASGMTMTLSAGTWWVSFSTVIVQSSSSATFEFQMYNGASGIAHTLRPVNGSNGAAYTVHTQGVVVSDGMTAVSIHWRRSSGGGSADMQMRSMFALRIA
jgi:hypothetical protein